MRRPRSRNSFGRLPPRLVLGTAEERGRKIRAQNRPVSTQLAIAVLAAIAMVVGACVGGDSRVAYIVFRGNAYSGGVATEFAIVPADLTAVGEASEAYAQVRGNTVFALRGVSPEEAIFMESDGAEAPYSIFFRDGFGEVPMWRSIPGLCPYLEQPPASGCP